LLMVHVSNCDPFMGPISRKVRVKVSSGSGAFAGLANCE
jgi:hypothetical protein